MLFHIVGYLVVLNLHHIDVDMLYQIVGVINVVLRVCEVGVEVAFLVKEKLGRVPPPVAQLVHGAKHLLRSRARLVLLEQICHRRVKEF